MAKGAKSMMQPINLIFRFLNHKSRVCIWLVEQNQVGPSLVVALCHACIFVALAFPQLMLFAAQVLRAR
jgi:hypothetical protein